MESLIIVALLGFALVQLSTSNEQIRRGNYKAQEVANKTPVELLTLRGFRTEVHYVRTNDGYHIHVVRAINPNHVFGQLKRPIVFNHGFLESSTIWLINSRDFKATPFSDELCDKLHLASDLEHAKNNDSLLNLPMMLSNHGYDVWLMSMRGTDFSLHHDTKSFNKPEFWDYSLDDFALRDVPAVMDYVREHTNSEKVGYVGHSQATFSIFALLATRPEYNDIIEPVVAFTPVAYLHHLSSASRPVFEDSLISLPHEGPFPPQSKTIRKTFRKTCRKKIGKARLICDFMKDAIAGEGEGWPAGFYYHVPYYSSIKVVRHFGQLITQKRFGRYDYGREKNLKVYNQAEPPPYNVSNIRTRSLCLVWAGNDALANPKDVEQFKAELKVPLFEDIFVENYNHFDLITAEEVGFFVNKPLLEAFEHFERKSGVCAVRDEYAYNNYDLDQANLVG